MKCTICDRCGKVIDRREHARTVTLTRPIPHREGDHCHAERDEHSFNDVIWRHDLCMSCAAEVETFLETVTAEDEDDGDADDTDADKT